MNTKLPPLPDINLLADLCRETAQREQVEPYLVEKDFYLTRLLWALHGELGDKALLKGGTLLSKVDLGYFRMSEDVDLILPGKPSKYGKGGNMNRMNAVRDALKKVKADVGLTLPFPGGEVSDKGAHVHWKLPYESTFGAQHILVEASLRPLIRAPREVRQRQLLAAEEVGDYSEAQCWALNEDEARAEKVRAACTREAGRDYYDLERLLDAGKEFSSPDFIELTDAKLAEMGSPPLMKQNPRPFGLSVERHAKLELSLKRELPAVLRKNAPSFELSRMLKRFEQLWSR